MKNLYSLLIAVATCSLSLAQGYIINPGNVLNETIETNGYYSSTISLDHDGTDSSNIVVEWELIDIQVNQDWDYSYCDYTNCYTGNITNGTMTPYGVGQSGFLKVNLMAPSVGSGYFVFKVNKVGDTNSDTLTFNFNAVLGLNNLSISNNISIYPNPSANGSFKVSNLVSGSDLIIQDALGKIVYQQEVIGTEIALNPGLRKGLYFVKADFNGKLYATRRLIVK